MAKSGRPFLNASRRRVETLDGSADKTMSTLTGDANPQGGTSSTSLESGETYIVTGATTSSRTITLPSASKGAWVKIIWGYETTQNGPTTWTVSSQAGEFINGQFFFFSTAGDSKTNAIVSTNYQMNGSSHISIIIPDDLQAGTMLSLVSDGDEWYTMENHLISSNVATRNGD